MRIEDVKIGETVILHCPQGRRLRRYPGTLRQFADLAAVRAMGGSTNAMLTFANPPTSGNYAIFEAETFVPGVKGFVCLKITERGLYDDEDRKVYLEPNAGILMYDEICQGGCARFHLPFFRVQRFDLSWRRLPARISSAATTKPDILEFQ